LSIPFQVACCGPALKLPLASVRTRRPVMSKISTVTLSPPSGTSNVIVIEGLNGLGTGS